VSRRPVYLVETDWNVFAGMLISSATSVYGENGSVPSAAPTHSHLKTEKKRNFEEALQCHTPAAAGSLYSLNFLSFTVSEIFFLLPHLFASPYTRHPKCELTTWAPARGLLGDFSGNCSGIDLHGR
jgi:hypothetical protein